ncbi:hypothetical protein [Azohydromonas australica]|uniref:hypothetical protein n=1 Tax=Azohydromonas australica TaxID=364039 RepID=UPI00041B80C0|nr:hypothetical protein [Azohydromonas australica]
MPTFNVPATFAVVAVVADSPERAVEVVDGFCDYGMQVSNDEQVIEHYALHADQVRPAAGTQQLSVEPLAISPEALGLEPCGEESGGHPASYLLGTLRVGDCTLHAEAYEVREVGNKWMAANRAFQKNVELAHGLGGDSLATMSHAGRRYILLLYPYAVRPPLRASSPGKDLPAA